MTTYVAHIPETDITEEIDIGFKSNCYVMAQGNHPNCDIIYLDPDTMDQLIAVLQELADTGIQE